MAIIVKAYILCGTDDPQEADNEISALLNGAAFDSCSTVLDSKVGVEQHMTIDSGYEDGEFVHHIVEASLMLPTSQFALPC